MKSFAVLRLLQDESSNLGQGSVYILYIYNFFGYLGLVLQLILQ